MRTRVGIVLTIITASAVALAGCSSSGGSSPAPGGASSPATGGGSTSAVADPTGAPATGTPIVLGNIGSYTGPSASANGGYQKGLQLWQSYINANGGIKGHPVQIKSVDDTGDPTKALTLAHQLVETDKIAAMLVPASSATGWQQYVSDAGIPTVTASGFYGVSPGLTFSASTSLDANNQSQAFMAKQAGAKSFAFIYCTEIAACQQGKIDNKKYAAAAGLSYSSYGVSGSAPDYTAVCLKMKQANVEAVALDAFPATSARLVADCARQNFKPQYVTVGVAITAAMPTTPAYNGILVSLIDFPWFQDNTPATKTFQNAITKYMPDLPKDAANYNANLSATWAGATTFATAAAQAADPTKSADLIKGLATIDKNDMGGLTPPLTFASSDLPDNPKAFVQPPTTCYFVIQLKDGKWAKPSFVGDNYQTCIS
jgi:branched-chain amino acid transport system substrate-binding protein